MQTKNASQIVTNNTPKYKEIAEFLIQKIKKLYWKPFAAFNIGKFSEENTSLSLVQNSEPTYIQELVSFPYCTNLLKEWI